jgi:hypothetical protein
MVQLEDVKRISHEVVESHNARGYSLVKLTPTDRPVGVLLNLTREPLVIDGKELKAKVDVRRFLWELSRGRSPNLRRKDRTWIWTRYLEDKNVSLVGIAASTTIDVAKKLAAVRPEYQFIEVA